MKIILLICLLFIFSACAPVRSGKIVDKIYQPAWTQTDTHWVEVAEGIKVPFTSTINHPAKYKLVLQATIEGKVKSGEVYVSPETYEAARVGDMYGVEKD